jgi:hypothetical protein
VADDGAADGEEVAAAEVAAGRPTAAGDDFVLEHPVNARTTPVPIIGMTARLIPISVPSIVNFCLSIA